MPTTRYVYFPFASRVVNPTTATRTAKEESKIRGNYIKEKKAEWNLRDKKYRFSSRGQDKMKSVKAGDVIYIQAHGFMNTGDSIGCDAGIGSVTAEGLVNALLADGLARNGPVSNLKLKIWACYSGYQFAGAVFSHISDHHADNFPGLIVDGYMGSTRVASPHKVVKIELNEDGEKTPPWAEGIVRSIEAVASSDDARVRYGPLVLVESDTDSSSDD